MEVFNWNEILENPQSFNRLSDKGVGISIGSFDGIHPGHKKLLSTLQEQSSLAGLYSGVITFTRPLPSLKKSSEYPGDLTTMEQRLEMFSKLKLDFVIEVNFDEEFARRTGIEFFQLLVQVLNLRLIAEGVDFRCGYKGATDVSAIESWAKENDIKTFFVEPVYYSGNETEKIRISSSYIRDLIKKGQINIANQLLFQSYVIDASDNAITQVLPPSGSYNCKNERGQNIKVQIKDGEISIAPSSNKIIF